MRYWLDIEGYKYDDTNIMATDDAILYYKWVFMYGNKTRVTLWNEYSECHMKKHYKCFKELNKKEAFLLML